MKKIIRLNENQILSLVNNILSEQLSPSSDYLKNDNLSFYDKYVKNINDGVYTNFDKAYDYKLLKGVWFAKKKNGTKWVDLSNNPKAISILTGKLNEYLKIKKVIDPNIKINQNDKYVKNINDGVYTNFDKVYDYKLLKGVWFAKKKNGTKWVDLSNNPKAISILTGKLNEYLKIKKVIDPNIKINQNDKFKSNEPGQTLPSLVKTGFKIDKTSFANNLGYYVRKCNQKGCAEFAYDMIGNVFGDAWQAYSKFQQYANVTPDLVKKMTDVFNSINKSGMPRLNDVSTNDTKSKNITSSLIPSDQKQFNNLPLGAVVGLYYPDSSNFDLAFFQSAIGMSRDNEGKWVKLRKPYFCKQSNKCEDTLWKQNDENKNINFVPNSTLKKGKSFIPNTHIGFIGYIDNKGERYVVHNVHQTVYAFPI